MFILQVLSWLLSSGIERALTCVLFGAAAVTLALSYRIRKSASRDAKINRSLRALMEKCEDLVAVCSPDGTIRYINASGTRLLGLESTSSSAMPLTRFAAPESRRLLESVVIPQALEKGSWQGSWQLRGRAGEGPQEMELRALPLPDAGARDPRVGIIARNVTQEHQTLRALQDRVQECERAMRGSQYKLREETLKQAVAAADAAAHAKREFLRNMSHEIRTPLNGVMGMAQLLSADTTLNEKQRRYLGIIESSGESLLRVINDILDFSKVEAGRLSLIEADFDLRERVETTLRLLENRAHAKNLELILTVSDAVPTWVKGDSSRLHQVLTNLVGNAIKFTERGSVLVRVESVEDQPHIATHCRLRFTVSDTGIGIPADYMPRLFTLFSQADETNARRFGGTGLGLAISRQLVELMGGEMEVESERGRGSTFRFSVLLGRAEPPLAVGPLEPRAPEHPVSGRVLVVEDDPTNSMLAKAMLRVVGCDPVLVESGEAALDWLEREKCDLILMDCQMPGLDGFETTRRIRARQKETGGKYCPIVALTANALDGDRERCLVAGMDDYLSKPYTRDALNQKLRRWLPISD